MSDDMLGYDRQRVRTLGRRTGSAIDHLVGVASDDPAAAGAVATAAAIAARLRGWLPVLAGVVGDTSMTGWAATGPTTMTGARGARPGSGDYGRMSDEEFLAALEAESATAAGAPGGPAPMPSELIDELARRWDDLDPQQREAAILAILGFGDWPPFATGQLAFLAEAVADMPLTPAFAAAVVDAAAGGEVPPELQPLADRIAVEFGDELALALNEVDDPALFAALGITVAFDLDPAVVSAFLGEVDSELAAAVEDRHVFDTDGFTLDGSVVAEDPDGGGWTMSPFTNTYGPGFYEGGGFVIGSDGEAYPLVIPTVVTDEGTFTADSWTGDPDDPSVANLGGADPGWEVVGVATGVERILETPPAGAIALADSAVGLHPLPPNSGLHAIAVNPGGLPYFAANPATAGQPVHIPNVQELGPAVPAAGVVNGVANAAVVATSADNQTSRAYMVVFEENADGRRRRARLVVYGVAENSRGDPVIVPEHLFVGPDGRLNVQGLSYGSPFGQPQPGQSPGLVVGGDVGEFYLGNGHDHPAFALDDAVIP